MRPQRPPRNASRATIAFAAVSAAALVLLARGPALAEHEDLALLASATQADDFISYTGTVTSLVYGHEGTVATVVRIDHQAPRLWRVWYVAPADAYGRMLVSNESLTYQYEPKQAKVYSNDFVQFAPAVAQQLDAEHVAKNYSVEAGATTTVAGRSTRTLSLVSKYSAALVERLWVDAATNLILQRETYHADGTIATKTTFDDIRIVKDFPKGLFDLSIPSGMTLARGAAYAKSSTKVTDVTAGLRFKFIGPQDLPDGFSLQKADVETNGGVQTVQLVYTDGIRSFSLFENDTGRLPQFESAKPKAIVVGDISGEYAYLGSDTLVSWNAGALNLTLVGDLSPRELAKIGASLKP